MKTAFYLLASVALAMVVQMFVMGAIGIVIVSMSLISAESIAGHPIHGVLELLLFCLPPFFAAILLMHTKPVYRPWITAPLGAMSFFSGHTAASTALTFAMFRTLRRLERPILSWVALGVFSAGAALIGTSRVIAGDHFPTDVLAGAVVGTANGFLVPALHRAPVRVIPAPVTNGGTFFLVGAF